MVSDFDSVYMIGPLRPTTWACSLFFMIKVHDQTWCFAMPKPHKLPLASVVIKNKTIGVWWYTRIPLPCSWKIGVGGGGGRENGGRRKKRCRSLNWLNVVHTFMECQLLTIPSCINSTSATKCTKKINFAMKWEEKINVSMNWILVSSCVKWILFFTAFKISVLISKRSSPLCQSASKT